MSAVLNQLRQALAKIDRPGSFFASGSFPAVLPGLEVEGLGPVGFPLTAKQAHELKKQCEQAPYGKGVKTVVDTNIRRVLRLKPEQFLLTNPDWEPFLKQMVSKVQEELGLEKQKLESHLYDLLLYEPGSFFLPHRDGEKLNRMVATLVVVLPSSYEGGELVVRHEGEERTIDFGGDNSQFRIHFAAFYADCEHEIRPLREGYRLCLIYNLTLAKSKKAILLRTAEAVENIGELLRRWAKQDEAGKLAITLEHQYTQDGLTINALKGVDRVKARVLAAARAECEAHLALLTFHESGSAEEDDGYYGGGRYWEEDEEDEDEEDEDEEDEDEEGEEVEADEEEVSGEYEMEEVFDSDLSADHWSDSQGKRVPFGPIDLEEEDLLASKSLRSVKPEEEYEGYTGNEGMTLDRWYRHAAIILWPTRQHFTVLCEAGSENAVQGLGLLVSQLHKAGKKVAASLKAQCVEFATAIIASWPERPNSDRWGADKEAANLLDSLESIDEVGLIRSYLTQVLARDASVDPGKTLATVCRKYGWSTFQPELEALFKATTENTIERNARLLVHVCLAGGRKEAGWTELCETLAQAVVPALEAIDTKPPAHDYWGKDDWRPAMLTGLARSLLATEQLKLLSRLVAHTLAHPKQYPLALAHVAALTTLKPWLAKHVKKPCPPLSEWIASCREQLESLTAQPPKPPDDCKRPAALSCHCADCAELSRFLADPHEAVHRFPVKENRRRHLEQIIRYEKCDLEVKTERKGSPYSLVCTKNDASYREALKTYHDNLKHLATIRGIEANVAK